MKLLPAGADRSDPVRPVGSEVMLWADWRFHGIIAFDLAYRIQRARIEVKGFEL